MKVNVYWNFDRILLMLITGVEEEPACALSDSCSGDIGEPGSDRLGEFGLDYNMCYIFYLFL